MACEGGKRLGGSTGEACVTYNTGGSVCDLQYCGIVCDLHVQYCGSGLYLMQSSLLEAVAGCVDQEGFTQCIDLFFL